MYKYFLIIFYFSSSLFAQNSELFKRFEYQQIISNNKNQTISLIQSYKEQNILANAYYKTENHAKCLASTQYLFKKFNQSLKYEDYILLIQTLQQNGLPADADSIKQILPINFPTFNLIHGERWATDTTLIIRELFGNSSLGEYDLQLTKGKIGYLTKIGNKNTGELSKWSGQPNFEIVPISFNDSSFSVGETVYSTSNQTHCEFNAVDQFGNIYLTTNDVNTETKRDLHPLQIKIVKAGKNTPTSLSINQQFYNTAHLSFSPNGKQVAFASDRPNGYGNSDIYIANIRVHTADTIIIDDVKNIGPAVNTAFRETFPVFQNDSVIAFSSDGKFVYGGLDLMTYNLYSKQTTVLPKPYNSENDDLNLRHYDSFTLITSNRGNKLAYNDNVYKISKKPLPIIPAIPVKIPVVIELKDPITQRGLAGQWVVIENETNPLDKIMVQTDSNGRVVINDFAYADSIGSYHVSSEPCNYKYTSSKDYSINHDTAKLNLSPEKRKLGDELGKELQLKSIRYELDKFDITEASKTELNILGNFLNKYPNISIELQSHTDSRGSDPYNLKLSINRAKAAKDYVVSLGINPNRIVSVGFGETRLLNSCGNNIKCSEAEHEINRRTEYVITKFNPCSVIIKPVLSNSMDTDKDGITDEIDGFFDSDNDGVPNYLDPK